MSKWVALKGLQADAPALRVSFAVKMQRTGLSQPCGNTLTKATGSPLCCSLRWVCQAETLWERLDANNTCSAVPPDILQQIGKQQP
ncbi:MAG: hypothetical protein E6Q75_15260 [Rheinheimera sp.]|nr:MAG: hypothetical protein E6Q75_15260 [Rheinheimera sp.]